MEEKNALRKPAGLTDIVGAKLIIRQAQDEKKSLENLDGVLSRLKGDLSLKIKVKLFVMLNRLAQDGKLRMPKQFNKEAKLYNNKHFYAIKPHENLRAYGWYSSKYPGVFFISHYKYKNKQKLNKADIERVRQTWREIENE